jgi:hypothetical protein
MMAILFSGSFQATCFLSRPAPAFCILTGGLMG